MGKWAKRSFGQETFEKIGIIFGGTVVEHIEKEIVGSFDKVVSKKEKVYHAYILERGGKAYPILFNVYGAPAVMDLVAYLHDGGCRNLLFIGYAYGGFKQNLQVGSVFVPDKIYHFDGIYHGVRLDRKFTSPDEQLKKRLEEVLTKNKIEYTKGANISVPSVTFQLPHANEEYEKIGPATVEMESAACLSRAQDLGVRAVSILIISDNRVSSIEDDQKRIISNDTKIKVAKTLIESLNSFKLQPLKTKKEFNIDEHLANIIHDPEDTTNIYRKGE
ncbi:MAG: hypothetical protein HYS32_03670 [Candidatus Woesearchaeota archaeon]|nr:MAG: hypothetical protein HYS32_03670 [Candidatus Woesearchaeota archaeon]